jgi:hypothetical protein
MTKQRSKKREKSWPELTERERDEKKAKSTWRNGARVRKP